MAELIPVPDGLAPERTNLAWRRTVLTAGVVALLFGRLALDGSEHESGVGNGSVDPVALSTLGAAAACWLALAAVARRRVRRLPAQEGVPQFVRAAGFITIVFAVLGIMLVLRGTV
jgi:uncharacterized membrane protein YidH (DUF202 family)